jgi:hypothetical protein
MESAAAGQIAGISSKKAKKRQMLKRVRRI